MYKDWRLTGVSILSQLRCWEQLVVDGMSADDLAFQVSSSPSLGAGSNVSGLGMPPFSEFQSSPLL